MDLNRVALVFLGFWLWGCAAALVPATSDPDQKIRACLTNKKAISLYEGATNDEQKKLLVKNAQFDLTTLEEDRTKYKCPARAGGSKD